MTIQVIGPGFGRTGTTSLKRALETLGLGPCHHMDEVLKNPGQWPFWNALAQGKNASWFEILEGYNSQVDWPGANYWREIAHIWPAARVILTVRDEEEWYKSYSETIGQFHKTWRDSDATPEQREIYRIIERIVKSTFGGDDTDKDKVIAAYRKRTADVEEAIAPNRLLKYNVKDGWEPLCAFLGKPVPSEPFPKANTRADFRKMFGGKA